MQERPDLYPMFMESARTWVLEFESTLLDFEKTPGDKELLNELFRIVHNLKGSSGNVGLTDISAFAHNIEDSLDLMRQGRLQPDKQLIDSLFKAIDLVADMVESSAADRAFDYSRCGSWINRMQTLQVRGPAL